jgi:hypothetical protein
MPRRSARANRRVYANRQIIAALNHVLTKHP